MNIFDVVGNAVLSLGKLPELLAGVVKKLIAVFLKNGKAAPKPEEVIQELNRRIQAEGPPRKVEDHISQIQAHTSRIRPGQDLLQRNAAAAPQRTPSVSAGALNQHPSAPTIGEILKKDGWDSITKYTDNNNNISFIKLINKTNNTTKDLTVSDFIKELKKHGFNV